MKNEIIQILKAENKKQLYRGEGAYVGFNQL